MISPTETAILARLAQQLAAGSVLLGTYDTIDFTDDAMPVVVGQVRLGTTNRQGFNHEC